MTINEVLSTATMFQKIYGTQKVHARTNVEVHGMPSAKTKTLASTDSTDTTQRKTFRSLRECVFSFFVSLLRFFSFVRWNIFAARVSEALRAASARARTRTENSQWTKTNGHNEFTLWD